MRPFPSAFTLYSRLLALRETVAALRRRPKPSDDRPIRARLELEPLEYRALQTVVSISGGGSLLEGSSSYNFYVTLDAASAFTVVVSYFATGGTANPSGDYATIGGTCFFNPGETSKNFSTYSYADDVYEPDETFAVTLTAPTNATIGTATATATILNDDPLPGISLSSASQTEGSAVFFTVTLSNPSYQTITVNYGTTDGTATTADSDYTSSTGTVTFTPGQMTQTLGVSTTGDTVYEPDETFTVTLSGPSNATLSAALATGTILNDDPLPVLSFFTTPSASEGTSGTTTFTFAVMLSGSTSQTVTVNYGTADGSATTADTDYTGTTGTLTFAPGQTSKSIDVAVKGDTKYETDETFAVALSGVSGATLSAANARATATIYNDDSQPMMSISDLSKNEGNSGTTPFGVTVTLSNASYQTVTVSYATGGGTATAGTDYTGTSGTLTFTPGQTTQTVPVSVSGDTKYEPDETFGVTLSGASNAFLFSGTATATITNDDSQPTISITPVTQAEGNSGTSSFVFAVGLSNASYQTVTVNYATANGTASAGSDYTADSGTLTFAPDQTGQVVTITVSGDTLYEIDETFTVNLTGASGGTIATPSATGTISNDDAKPTISISDVSHTEGNSGTTSYAFAVTLSAVSGATATAGYTTTNGTATAGSDYTSASGSVSFSPGETLKTVTVSVAGDTLYEHDETFTVDLSGASEATLLKSSGVGTITNDDTKPVISIDGSSHNEGNSGTTSFLFTATLSAVSGVTAGADYATTNGTATTGDNDFASTSGTVSFAPGETLKTFTVAVTGDTKYESDETFAVALSNPSEATLGTSPATVTITNDDSQPTISIASVDPAGLNEGNSSTTNSNFTVTLSNASAFTVTVRYDTGDDTARIADGDYTAATGTVTFSPGETLKTVTVLVTGDTKYEYDEAFSVTLSNPVGASLAVALATGTILNDDGPPTVSMESGTSYPEGDSGTTEITFKAVLSEASGRPVTVGYATGDGTAQAADDDYDGQIGTFTYDPGVTEQTLIVDAVGDTKFEANETITLTLANAVGAVIGIAAAAATLVNDDPPPAPSITDLSLDTGWLAFDRLTSDNVPLISGTSVPDATINVYLKDGLAVFPVLSGTATADANGDWTYTFPALLSDDRYTVTAEATAGGFTSQLSAPFVFTLDTKDPTVDLYVDPITYNTRPPVLVTADDLNGFPAVANVALDADLNGDGDFGDAGERDYATAPLADGMALFLDYTPFTPGTFVLLRARVTDLAGNEGSAVGTVVVLPTPSSVPAPVITGMTTDTGASNADRITADTTPTVSGTATSGALVTVYRQGPLDATLVPLGTVTATGGVWSFTSAALADARYVFTATATVSGRTSVTAAPILVTVDTTAPFLAAIAASPTPNTQPPIAVLAVDLGGGIAAGATVVLDVDLNNDGDFLDAGEADYASTTLAYGTAVFTGYTALSVGTYRVRARALDLAGNEGASAAATLQIVSPPTTAPVITNFTDDTGASSSDRVTYDTTPTLSGTATAYATVTLYHQGTHDAAPVSDGSTTADGSGAWTFTEPTGLGDDTYVFTATATVLGTTSGRSGPLVATIDTVAPAVTVTAPARTYDTAPPIAVGAADRVGFSNPVTVALDVDLNGDYAFDGAGESGYATGTLVNDAVTFTGYTALTAGFTYHVRARVTDLAGNEGTSPVASITILAPLDLVSQLRSTYAGMAGWTTAQDGLAFAGDVSAGQAVDVDDSPSTVRGADGALVYHSQESAPAPVVQVLIPGTNEAGVPSAVTGTLTWDGTVVGTLAYDLSALAPGDDMVFAAAAPGGAATGRHTYTLDLFVDYSGTADDFTPSVTGYTFVANRSASPYGAGWSFADTDALVTVTASGAAPGGVLREFGAGGWAFYADNGSGGYVAPPGDGGALVALGGGGWAYTSYDGQVETFNAAGEMTTWTAANTVDAVTYTYDASGGVATVASPDGGLATFVYSSGLLATVAAPGGRTTTFTHTGTDLTAITDPAGGSQALTYSSHRLTGDAEGVVSQSYTYTSGGLAQTVQLGSDPVGTITAGLGAGLGTAAVAHNGFVPGTVTDAVGVSTSSWYDSFGQPVAVRAANGATEVLDRSADGWVVRATDPLVRTTTLMVNKAGQVLGEIRPDGTSAAWDYSGANGSLVRFKDFRGAVTSYTNDVYGERTSETDPLNHTTTYAWAAGLLQSITDAVGDVVTELYDAHRRSAGEQIAGVTQETESEDADGFVGGIVDALGNVTTIVNDADGRPTAVTDANGHTTTTVYDASGHVLRTIDALGVVTSFGYDGSGRRTVEVDAYGTGLERRTTWVYDGIGRLIATIDPLGNRSTSVYDAVGNTIATVDPMGVRTSAQYDKAGELTAIRDVYGRATAFGYDKLGRQVSTTDALNRTVTDVYDAMSNVIATVDALAHAETRVFDAANRMVAEIDPDGNESDTAYDAANRPIDDDDPDGNDAYTVYDARGRVWANVDADGKRTTNTYDDDNRLIAVTDPNRHTTTTVYDAVGNVIATIDPMGRANTLVYDALNRVIATVDPLGHRNTTVYDALGRMVAQIDALGNATTTVYDAGDRVIATVDALGNRSTTVYDADSRVIATIAPDTKATSYNYDLVGNRTSTVDPLLRVWGEIDDADGEPVGYVDGAGNTSFMAFDDAGREVSETDADGNVTTTVYDAAGRITATIDPMGFRTSYGYDRAGNRTTITDPNNHTTTSAYDHENRKIAETDAAGKTTTWVYDGAGQLVRTIDPLGNVTTYLYDDDGYLTGEDDPDGNEADTVYDAAGRVIAEVDEDGNRTSYGYDAANRRVSVTDPDGRTTTTVYNAANWVIATIAPNGKATSYGYDTVGRQISTTTPKNETSTTVYDGAGEVLATIDARGFRTTGVYDAAGRLQGTIDALGKQTAEVYDAAGRPIAEVDALGNRTTTGYDANGRVWYTIDPRNNRTTFGYDSAGNQITVTDARNKTTTTTYDVLNRVVATTDPLGGTTTTVYDDASRVIATVDALGNRTSYGYDHAGRLVTVTDPRNKTTTTVYDAAGRVLATIDPMNRRTSTVYDAAGNVVATIDATNKTATTLYDTAGRISASIDELGDVTTYVYDDDDQLIATIDPLGNRTTFGYDAAGDQVSTTDAQNRTVTTIFDALGRTVGMLDATNKGTSTVYDAAGRVWATIDARGKRTTYGYDSAGNQVTVTDPLGRVTTSVYDADRNVIAVTDPRGNTTSYGYDAAGRPVTETDAQNRTTTTVYDGDNRMIATIDPLGNRTTIVYDAAGEQVGTIDALNHRATSVYDDDGRLIATVDELGNTTSYGYDADDRRVSVTDPLGHTTTTVYDAGGRRVATIDARGDTTTTEYDAANRVLDTINALGQRTTFGYNGAGDRITMTDALGNVTTTVYDADRRVIATIDPLNHRTTTVYDDDGQVIATIDAAGDITTTVYDDDGHAVATIDPRGYRTTSVYDGEGNRTSLTDADGNTTTWAYDSLGRVTSETDPLNHTATYAYDADGRKTSETDRLGQRRDFTFDADGRVLTEAWYTAGGSLTQTQTWTYDALGQMLTAQDPDGTYTFTYDAAGRVNHVDEPFGLSLTMGYDAVGNRTLVQDSLGGVTTVTFDALNRQLSEQLGGSGVSATRFDRAYTVRGQLASVTRYSDLAGTSVVGTTTYDYDAAGRETHQKDTGASGAALAEYTYTYDVADRLTAKVENGTSTTFNYDTASELTQDGAATFGYDATGDRTNTGYATGTGNRLTTDGTSTYTYDANGNQTQSTVGAAGATWVYTYDNRNQLLTAAYSATLGGTVTQRVTYAYDAFGVRISRAAWDGTTTTTAHNGVDGWDPAKAGATSTENFDTILELDGSNALVARTVFGPGFLNVIARQSAAGALQWNLTDYQGSVRAVIDNSDTVLATTTYSAFGVVTAGTVSGPTGFNGYTWDPVLQLWVTATRFYNPWTGRFTQQDAMGFAAGDPDLFRYVGNRVTNATDPSGNWLLTTESQMWIWETIRDEGGIDLKFHDFNGKKIITAARDWGTHGKLVDILSKVGLTNEEVRDAMIALYGGRLGIPLDNDSSPPGDMSKHGGNFEIQLTPPEILGEVPVGAFARVGPRDLGFTPTSEPGVLVKPAKR